MRKVAVFDTNILLSGIGWKGKPYQCIELARAGTIDGLSCRQILDELAEKLQTKLAFNSQQALDAVADLLTFVRVIGVTGNLKVITADPDDDKVIECAVVGSATHIITGDRRHLLPLGIYQGIQIVSAADFLGALSTP